MESGGSSFRDYLSEIRFQHVDDWALTAVPQVHRLKSY